MNTLRSIIIKLGLAASALGLILVVIPRYFWFARRRLPKDAMAYHLSLEGSDLALARLERGHDRLVIVAHGFLKSMHTPPIVRFVEQAAKTFDVLLLDLAGHGQSEGQARLDVHRVADSLGAVVKHARGLGYERIALVGYSLGGAAAIRAAANGASVDAVVSVSSPVDPRWTPDRTWRTGRVAWWFRLMGTRVAEVVRLVGWPLKAVSKVSPRPLLVVHCGQDTFVPEAASKALYNAAKEPKDWIYAPQALHAWPTKSNDEIIAWLDQHL